MWSVNVCECVRECKCMCAAHCSDDHSNIVTHTQHEHSQRHIHAPRKSAGQTIAS